MPCTPFCLCLYLLPLACCSALPPYLPLFGWTLPPPLFTLPYLPGLPHTFLTICRARIAPFAPYYPTPCPAPTFLPCPLPPHTRTLPAVACVTLRIFFYLCVVCCVPFCTYWRLQLHARITLRILWPSSGPLPLRGLRLFVVVGSLPHTYLFCPFVQLPCRCILPCRYLHYYVMPHIFIGLVLLSPHRYAYVHHAFARFTITPTHYTTCGLASGSTPSLFPLFVHFKFFGWFFYLLHVLRYILLLCLYYFIYIHTVLSFTLRAHTHHT